MLTINTARLIANALNIRLRMAVDNFRRGSPLPRTTHPAQAAYIEGVVHHLLKIFRLRQKSLVRAVLLSLGAFAASLHIAGFPHIENLHSSYWQILALLVAIWGMAETARCLQRKWSFYHAGVLLLLYADLMILAAIVLMLFAP